MPSVGQVLVKQLVKKRNAETAKNNGYIESLFVNAPFMGIAPAGLPAFAFA